MEIVIDILTTDLRTVELYALIMVSLQVICKSCKLTSRKFHTMLKGRKIRKRHIQMSVYCSYWNKLVGFAQARYIDEYLFFPNFWFDLYAQTNFCALKPSVNKLMANICWVTEVCCQSQVRPCHFSKFRNLKTCQMK